jgi:hypothetical protein
MHDSQVRLIAHRGFVLPGSFAMSDVAERARVAIMELMQSASTPFCNADLAEWLKGSYRRATQPGSVMLKRLPTPFAIARGSVDVHVDVLTLQAREETLEVLRRVSSVRHRDTSFTFEALNRGWIVPCRDVSGVRGHVAVDAPDMKLYERALSLVAVDYIARPVDYEENMALCPLCEMPYFDDKHGCRRIDSIAVRRAG